MAHADLPDAGRVSHFEIDAWLPAPNEKAALVGDPVPAGDANRYLTQNHPAGGFSGFANPTASVGLVAVNGVATTAMRSDGAPALDQAIIPTWGGLHTYGAGLAVSAGQGIAMADETCWFGIGAALERINVNAAGYVSVMGANFGIGEPAPTDKFWILDANANTLRFPRDPSAAFAGTVGMTATACILRLDADLAADGSGIWYRSGAADWFAGVTGQTDNKWVIVNEANAPFVAVLSTGEMGLGGVVAALGQLHVDQPSGTGAIPVLILDQGDVSEQHIVCSMSGADVDFPAIIELAVTGTPAFWWDESADAFALTNGLEVGDVVGGNFTHIESDGTVEFNGDATVWNDIYFPMSSGRIGGANQPTWAAFQGNTMEYSFAINDYIHLPTQEIAHSYKEGSDIKLHVHIVLDGSDVGDTDVNYEIEYTIGDEGEVMSAAAVVTSGDYTITGGTADRTHIFIQVGTIVGTNLLMQAALKMRFRRIALVGAGNAPSNDPFVLMVGVHIEEDTVGSRTETTK